jgi:hypothetical protein
MNTRRRYNDPLVEKMRLIDEPQIDDLLAELGAVATPTTLGFLNQHGYNIAQRQPEVHRLFLGLDYLLRDGIGMKLACRLNGAPPKANLNGSDLIPRIVETLIASQGERLELFAMGTAEPWLSKGANALLHGQPCKVIDGFQPVEQYLEFLQRHRTPGKIPVVLLAMGMPKQERVAAALQRAIDGPALLICGGAILDFAAGRFPRAPRWIRVAGMEWLYRLAKEPYRLFGRYVIGIPLFLFHATRNSRAGQNPPTARAAGSVEPSEQATGSPTPTANASQP